MTFNLCKRLYFNTAFLNLFKMGLSGDAHGWGGGVEEGGSRKTSLPKICHTYPTTTKLGTVIPCPKKIQKIFESSDTSAEISIFSPEIRKFC